MPKAGKGALKIKEVRIDPTASVHPTAELDTGVEVGPYTVIAEGVRIGSGTRIGSHVVVDKWTSIGKNTTVFHHVSVGAPPQDLSYREERSETVIGDSNVIREFVTIHRATTKDKLKTVIGNNNYLMNYVHIAHDCDLGDNILMSNNATLAGHVAIDDFAIIGGFVAVHQHVRIGSYCMIGGVSAVSKDIPPYVMAVGNRAHIYGLNSVGLRRKGFSKKDMDEIKRSYNIIFRSSLTIKESIEALSRDLPGSVHAQRFIEFIKGCKRGIARERIKRKSEGEDED